jgi:uncharacterized protein YuzE
MLFYYNGFIETNQIACYDAFTKEMPHTRIWTTYDKEADVLYINFKKPSHADDSELTDDDIIIRYEKGEVIGVTILNASKRRN